MLIFLRSCLIAVLLTGPTTAFACTMNGDKPVFITEVEALNTAIESGDYAKFVSYGKEMGGLDVSAIAEKIRTAFPDGFDECRTLVQRRDVGGMNQNIVLFQKANQVLIFYWLTAIENGRFSLLSFSFSQSLDSMLAELH